MPFLPRQISRLARCSLRYRRGPYPPSEREADMFRHILVPLDGSAFAEAALPAALTLNTLANSGR